MAQVQITGWREGLRKVSMTRALQEHAGLGLGAAKSVTDAILDGEVVDVPCASEEIATALADRLAGLGAIVEVAR